MRNRSTNFQYFFYREKLERKEIELKTKGILTSPDAQQQIAAEAGGSAVLGAGRIAQLEAELKLAKVIKL